MNLEKKISVSKYTFSGPKVTQKAIKNTLNYFLLFQWSSFFKMDARIYMF